MFGMSTTEPRVESLPDYQHPSITRGDVGGEDEGFRDVFLTQYTSLTRLSRLYTNSADEAEDVVQEAMGKAWATLRRKRRLDVDLVSYVRVAVLNEARGRLRKSRSARRYDEGQQALVPPAEPAGPAESAIRTFDSERVVNALGTLPRRQREILALRFFADASIAEVAAALDISEGTVKTHQHRGLNALGEALGAQL